MTLPSAKKENIMLEELKKKVYEANMELPRRNLVTYTWGNVSGIDREKGLVVIKPSGVEYEELTPDMLVVLDLDGNIVEGDLNPSSDTKTHIELYKAFPQLGGIVHTHSPYAVAWAQAGKDIPCYGTTHADYFYGPIPCARHLTQEELDEDYELNTGNIIVEEFKARGVNIVIYANQLTRTGFPAMQHAAELILSTHRAKECDDICMPFKDIIRLIPEE